VSRRSRGPPDIQSGGDDLRTHPCSSQSGSDIETVLEASSRPRMLRRRVMVRDALHRHPTCLPARPPRHRAALGRRHGDASCEAASDFLRFRGVCPCPSGVCPIPDSRSHRAQLRSGATGERASTTSGSDLRSGLTLGLPTPSFPGWFPWAVENAAMGCVRLTRLCRLVSSSPDDVRLISRTADVQPGDDSANRRLRRIDSR